MKIKIKYSEDYPKDWGPPAYGSDGAAAFDFKALAIEEEGLYRTGLHFEIPEGYVMLIFSRSGHGFSYGIRLANCVGVIDSDYRGEIKIKLVADKPPQMGCLNLGYGGRIAQGIIIPLPKIEFEVVDGLSSTIRGSKGFGSTGM